MPLILGHSNRRARRACEVGLQDASLRVHSPEVARVLIAILVGGLGVAAAPDWGARMHNCRAFCILTIG